MVTAQIQLRVGLGFARFLFGVIGTNYLSISISILEAIEKPTPIRVFFCHFSEFHYLWETDRFITFHHEGCRSFWTLTLILAVHRCAALSLGRQLSDFPLYVSKFHKWGSKYWTRYIDHQHRGA